MGIKIDDVGALFKSKWGAVSCLRQKYYSMETRYSDPKSNIVFNYKLV